MNIWVCRIHWKIKDDKLNAHQWKGNGVTLLFGVLLCYIILYFLGQALETQNVLTSTKFIDGCTSYKAESISITRLEKHPQAEVEAVEVYEDAMLLLNQPRK